MATYISALPVGTVVHGPERDYRVVRVLGQGGFGITYLVEGDVVVGNITATVRFALKEHFISQICDRDETTRRVIHSKAATETVDRSLKSFVKESRRLHNLGVDHPNIVKINEVFEANGTAYYVMQYLEGETLTAYVGRVGAMSADETMFFMRPLIEAVADLHDARLTHYDIKPDNIILSRGKDGVVRAVLIDFGLAKHYDRSGQATSTVATSGYTPGYAPMEQYAGLSDFSPQTDVYSLAATIYFCLTGHTPAEAFAFASESISDDFGANVPAAITAAVTHAMQLKRDQRPSDARALLQELDGAAPSPASVDTVIKKDVVHKQVQADKRKYYFLYAAIALLVLLSGCLVWLLNSKDEPKDLFANVPVADPIEIKKDSLTETSPTQDTPVKPLPAPKQTEPIQESVKPKEEKTVDKPAEPEKSKEKVSSDYRTTPRNFDLCAKIDGKAYYFSIEEWDDVPDKSAFTKLGIYVSDKGGSFLVDLYDSKSRMTWYEAEKQYGDKLPTLRQAQIIARNSAGMGKTIAAFGGDRDLEWWYWTREKANSDYIRVMNLGAGIVDNRKMESKYKVRAVYPVP